jgi:hypothetical protein
MRGDAIHLFSLPIADFWSTELVAVRQVSKATGSSEPRPPGQFRVQASLHDQFPAAIVEVAALVQA